jgi:hypothetical protein
MWYQISRDEGYTGSFMDAIKQKNPELFLTKDCFDSLWCPREDSNLHVVKH